MAVGPIITGGLKYTPSLVITLGYTAAVGGATYPDPADVLVGVQYGPTGTDYTGTLSIVLDLETGRFVRLLGRKVGLSL